MRGRSLRPGQGARAHRQTMGSAAGLSFYRMIAEHGSDVASVHARDGRFVFVSPSIEQVFAWSPQEVMGVSLVDLAHAEEQLDLRMALQVEGGTEKVAYRIRCGDGVERWAESTMQLGPTPDVIVCMTRDITEHKERAALLEQTVLHVLERSPLPMLVVQRGHVAHANTCARETLCGLGAATRPSSLDEVLHDDDVKKAFDLVRHIEEGIERALAPREVRVILRDGAAARATMEVSSIIHRSKSGALVSFSFGAPAGATSGAPRKRTSHSKLGAQK